LEKEAPKNTLRFCFMQQLSEAASKGCLLACAGKAASREGFMTHIIKLGFKASSRGRGGFEAVLDAASIS
jgi:hypothetical protein